jgi:Mg/Co/Ni transporter MgtE
MAFLSEAPEPAPKTDVAFVAEVMQRVARRELGVRLAVGAAWAVAGGAMLWACAPVLNLAVANLAPVLTPAAGMLALIGAGVVLGAPLLRRP